jgi:hypothetical protein
MGRRPMPQVTALVAGMGRKAVEVSDGMVL